MRRQLLPDGREENDNTERERFEKRGKEKQGEEERGDERRQVGQPEEGMQKGEERCRIRGVNRKERGSGQERCGGRREGYG